MRTQHTVQEERSVKIHALRIATGAAMLALGALQIQGGARASLAAPAQRHAQVKIGEASDRYGFSPATLTVHVGTKVTWVNDSDAPHTVTGTGKWTFSSKTFTEDHRVSVTFTKTGTYHYMCAVHPYMQGTVIVKK
jgi:plastocyanin